MRHRRRSKVSQRKRRAIVCCGAWSIGLRLLRLPGQGRHGIARAPLDRSRAPAFPGHGPARPRTGHGGHDPPPPSRDSGVPKRCGNSANSGRMTARWAVLSISGTAQPDGTQAGGGPMRHPLSARLQGDRGFCYAARRRPGRGCVRPQCPDPARRPLDGGGGTGRGDPGGAHRKCPAADHWTGHVAPVTDPEPIAAAILRHLRRAGADGERSACRSSAAHELQRTGETSW